MASPTTCCSIACTRVRTSSEIPSISTALCTILELLNSVVEVHPYPAYRHASLRWRGARNCTSTHPPQTRVSKEALEKSLSIKWLVTATYFPSGVRQQVIVGKRLVIVQKIWYS